MIDAKEKTALATSVGADERQSFQTSSANIIPTSDTEINHPDEISSENLEEIYRQMQRMNDPAYLHTVSMNDLYETVLQSRLPVIDGLLYSGTYLFAGAPKVGKSFFMGLEQKLDAMLNRQLYSRYKTAPNEEEREQARQEYLDRRGVPQSYRWTTPPWEL